MSTELAPIEPLVSVGLVAFGTATAGPVAFVALAAPQVAQRLAGTAFPPPFASGLTGAVMVLGSDLVARKIVVPEVRDVQPSHAR